MSSTKLLVTVLLFTAVITSPLYSQTAMAPWAGYGSAENPYQISTLENLYWIAEDEIRWGYSYVQTADIDAGETKSWFSGSGWAPIGNSPTSFTGNYDGRGHRIDSLFINRPTQENIGLFGRTDEAIIDRVGLTNCNITGNNYVGGLVGDALSGTLIISCYSTGSVSGRSNVGGLVGSAHLCTISSCYSTGAVSGNKFIGGLVGYAPSNTISSCYSTGAVSGNEFIGGLVGWASNRTISNSYSTGAVSGSSNVGGLVGWASSTISNSYSNGAVSGNDGVGGLVGDANDGCTISSSYSTGSVTGSSSVGGLIGYNSGSTVNKSFWDVDSSGQTTSAGGTSKTTAEMKTPSTYTDSNWDFMGETGNGKQDIWGISSRDNNGYPFLRWQGYKLEQTITFTVPDTVVYADTSFIIASASSGLPVAFTSTDVSVARVSGDTIFIAGAGSASISAHVNGNGTYYPADSSKELTVRKKPVSITGITTNNKVYDGTTAATLSGGALSGLVTGDLVTLTKGTGVFANKNAGTGKTITASGYAISGTDASNYTISQPSGLTADITRKSLTVTGVTAAGKVYDGTTAATLSGGTLSGLITGDIVTLTNGTGAFASKNVGTGKAITASGYALSGTDASNYTLTGQPSGLTADITKKSLTVTGVTAADKVYNGTTAATLSGGTLSGLVTGDAVTLTKGTGVFANKNAGTGKAITASGYAISGTDASNYTLTGQPSGLTADITRKSLTVTGVTAADKVYDGTTEATLSGGTLSGLVTGDVVTLTKGTGVFASKKVGTGKAITASGYAISGTGASNYTISQPSGITADITPAPLTIKAADAEKGRYEEDPVFTVTFTGFVAGDNSSAVSGLIVEREPGEKPGTYSIIPSGASAANYEIEYVNGTFTINGSTSVLNNHTINENKISRPVKGIFIASNPVSLSSAKADFRIVAGYPSELRVTIYDASGNAVFEKNASAYTGTVDMSWNLYTNGGHRAGSGVYLIVAKVKSRVNGSSEVLMEKLGLR